MEIYDKTDAMPLKGRNMGGVGEILIPSASISLRARPWASATCVDGWRNMENEKLREKEEMRLKGRTQGGVGEILHPSASDRLRGRAWASAT